MNYLPMEGFDKPADNAGFGEQHCSMPASSILNMTSPEKVQLAMDDLHRQAEAG
jgi:hypothetical protein